MPDPNSSDSIDVNDLCSGVRQTLEHLQRIGVSYLPAPIEDKVARIASQWNVEDHDMEPVSAAPGISDIKTPATQSASSTTKPLTKSPILAGGPDSYATTALPVAQRQASLDQWRQQVADCTMCKELSCTRKQTVFGQGNPEARICFFGEAPGADEDRQGQPFVGRAGQLLTKIIEAAKLHREDVYILNTLKCRPPGNRNPLPEELANCRPYFETQLEIIQPEYIVCLGLFAAQSLLKTTQSIGRMRGRFHQYLGSKVLVTYHPSYLLRNEKMKGAAWQDIQMMMRDMGTLEH